MSQAQRAAWRNALAVGWLVASGAVVPLIASAQQQPPPSGATIDVGGVEPPPRSSEVASVQSPPIVLPNTGGGPAPDDRPWEFTLGGLTTLSVGAFLRWRAVRAPAGS
jgi:hypothetical protein